MGMLYQILLKSQIVPIPVRHYSDRLQSVAYFSSNDSTLEKSEYDIIFESTSIIEVSFQKSIEQRNPKYNAMIIEHLLHCHSPLCPAITWKVTQNYHCAVALAIRILKEYLIAHPEAIWVRFFLIALLLSSSQNLLLAWELAQQAEFFPLNMHFQFFLHCLQNQLKQIFSSKNIINSKIFSMNFIGAYAAAAHEKRFRNALLQTANFYTGISIKNMLNS